MDKVITNPNQLTPQWLTDCLRRNGYLARGEVVSVTLKEPFGRNPKFFIMPFEVAYSSDAPESMPQKLVIKSNRKNWGMIEATFYSEIAPVMADPPVPSSYHVAFDDETGFFHLILEDVRCTHMMTEAAPDKTQFEAIVDELLKIHTYWWNDPRIQQTDFAQIRGGMAGMAQVASPEEIQQQCQLYAKDLPQRFSQFDEPVPRGWQTICESAIASWGNLFVERTSEKKGITLIHGDCHPWNIFLPRNPTTNQPILFDWEDCACGIGLHDLAYMLIKCRFPSETRQELEKVLIRRYYEGLLEYGIEDYTWENCLRDYRLSVIFNLHPPLIRGRIRELEAVIDAFESWSCAELLR